MSDLGVQRKFLIGGIGCCRCVMENLRCEGRIMHEEVAHEENQEKGNVKRKNQNVTAESEEEEESE